MFFVTLERNGGNFGNLHMFGKLLVGHVGWMFSMMGAICFLKGKKLKRN